MDEFLEAAALPEQFRWLGRMRRLFAVVYASAAQAIDYCVLPWSRKATLKAILACTTDAMDQLTANFSDSQNGGGQIKSDDTLLAEFKRRVEDAEFVRIERNTRKPHLIAQQLKKADGFIQATRLGRVRYHNRSIPPSRRAPAHQMRNGSHFQTLHTASEVRPFSFWSLLRRADSEDDQTMSKTQKDEGHVKQRC
jgi:hypothetical protein